MNDVAVATTVLVVGRVDGVSAVAADTIAVAATDSAAAAVVEC